MPFKFHGGVHPNYMKAPDVPVTVIAPPPQVVLPMMQHIGAPCKPLVAVGDYVKMGQKIADNPAPVSAPIHATVSGKVIAIEPRPHPLGDMIPAIVIENDFQDTPCTDLAPLTPEQLKDPEDPRRPWQGRSPHHQRRRVRAVPQRRPPDHEEPP